MYGRLGIAIGYKGDSQDSKARHYSRPVGSCKTEQREEASDCEGSTRRMMQVVQLANKPVVTPHPIDLTMNRIGLLRLVSPCKAIQ